MRNQRVGELHRKLRHRAQLTQQALSQRSGVPRWKIGKLEAEELSALRFDEVDRCLAALGAELDVRAGYRGAGADRLLDEGHAQIVALVVGVLRGLGWDARVEVSFSIWGERGGYDVLAWHPKAKVLLVVEVKSELGSVEGTLRPLNIKVRLARKVGRDSFGWQTSHVGTVLVLPESRTARRAVERHATVLRNELPATSQQLRTWLRAPAHEIAGIRFVSPPTGQSWPRNPSLVVRVRARRSAESNRPSYVPPGQR